MSVKPVLFFIFLLFLQITSKAEEHLISLNDFDLGVPNAGYYIEEIIDARDEKYCIGFVQKGVSNKKVAAFFEKGLVPELEHFFANSIKKQEGGMGLILRVNKLFIYETTYSTREFAVAEANVTFIKKEKDKYFELFEVGHAIEKSGLDVTKSHGKNIVQALRECFNQFNEKKEFDDLVFQAIDESELNVNPINKRIYKILNTAQYRKGVYKNFNDFLLASPHQHMPFSIDYRENKKKKVEYATLLWDSKIKKEGKEIWGFSDGRNNYFRIENWYYKISREDSLFLVKAPGFGDGSAVVTGAILGGVVGALIAEGISSNSHNFKDYKIDFPPVK